MPHKDENRREWHVVPTSGGWAVKKSGATRPAKTYRTKAEATQAADRELRSKGGELRIQGKDGRWRESYTVGLEAIGKFNAIEGVRLSREMKGAFREFDRRGLSHEERRAAIERKFSKKG
jgi:hypothetical protein